MKKSMKKNKFFVPSLLMAAMLLVLVGGQSVLRAQSDPKSVEINNYAESGVVINVAGGRDSSSGNESESLGAANTRFPHGLDVTGDGVYAIDGSTVINANGGFTPLASSTMPLNSISNINLSLTQSATSGASVTGTANKKLNDGAIKLCTDPVMYEFTSNGKFGANWTVGTTTLSGDASLTTTSTATLIASHAVVTSTTGIIGSPRISGQGGSYWVKSDKYGNAPSSTLGVINNLWEWKTGEYIVAFSDNSGATSTDTFSNSDFTTPVGKLMSQCWNAY